jgi:hypothetical protein
MTSTPSQIGQNALPSWPFPSNSGSFNHLIPIPGHFKLYVPVSGYTGAHVFDKSGNLFDVNSLNNSVNLPRIKPLLSCSQYKLKDTEKKIRAQVTTLKLSSLAEPTEKGNQYGQHVMRVKAYYFHVVLLLHLSLV